MKKEEFFDVYDINKNKVGKTKIRDVDKLEPGEYAIGVQAIIMNSNKEILISKRSENKKVFPLFWECNGGAVLAGEEFVDALVREIFEELGIMLNKENAVFLKSVQRKTSFIEIYLFKKEISISDLKFADGEATEGMWVDIDKFLEMLKNGQIVPNVNFDYDDYLKSLELLNLK